MNVYLVSVTIYAGEYQKKTDKLIIAKCHSVAAHYAIYCESHDPASLDWSENRVVDMGGEFAYSASTKKLNIEHANVLSEHLRSHRASLADLSNAGNYSEHCVVSGDDSMQPCIKDACLAQATKSVLEESYTGSFYDDYMLIAESSNLDVPVELNVKHTYFNWSGEELIEHIHDKAHVAETVTRRVLELCDKQLAYEGEKITVPIMQIFINAMKHELSHTS